MDIEEKEKARSEIRKEIPEWMKAYFPILYTGSFTVEELLNDQSVIEEMELECVDQEGELNKMLIYQHGIKSFFASMLEAQLSFLSRLKQTGAIKSGRRFSNYSDDVRRLLIDYDLFPRGEQLPFGEIIARVQSKKPEISYDSIAKVFYAEMCGYYNPVWKKLEKNKYRRE